MPGPVQITIVDGMTIKSVGRVLGPNDFVKNAVEEIGNDLKTGKSHTLTYTTLFEAAKNGLVLPNTTLANPEDNIIAGAIAGTKLKTVRIVKKPPHLAEVTLQFGPLEPGDTGYVAPDGPVPKSTVNWSPGCEIRSLVTHPYFATWYANGQVYQASSDSPNLDLFAPSNWYTRFSGVATRTRTYRVETGTLTIKEYFKEPALCRIKSAVEDPPEIAYETLALPHSKAPTGDPPVAHPTGLFLFVGEEPGTEGAFFTRTKNYKYDSEGFYREIYDNLDIPQQ